MSYQPRPNPQNDTLLSSRDQIRTNFSLIQTDFAVNHNDFNESGPGKHKFLQMPEQASAPSTAANEFGLYCDEGNNVSQLIARRESDGGLIQMTASDVSNTTAQAAAGYSCLPGGMLIQWGQNTVNASSSSNINFPKSFANASSIYSIISTQNSTSTSSDSNGNVNVVSASQFTLSNSSSQNRTFYWIAIGVA